MCLRYFYFFKKGLSPLNLCSSVLPRGLEMAFIKGFIYIFSCLSPLNWTLPDAPPFPKHPRLSLQIAVPRSGCLNHPQSWRRSFLSANPTDPDSRSFPRDLRSPEFRRQAKRGDLLPEAQPLPRLWRGSVQPTASVSPAGQRTQALSCSLVSRKAGKPQSVRRDPHGPAPALVPEWVEPQPLSSRLCGQARGRAPPVRSPSQDLHSRPRSGHGAGWSCPP